MGIYILFAELLGMKYPWTIPVILLCTHTHTHHTRGTYAGMLASAEVCVEVRGQCFVLVFFLTQGLQLGAELVVALLRLMGFRGPSTHGADANFHVQALDGCLRPSCLSLI